MIWVYLAILILLAVFLRRIMLPMLFGAAIGGAVVLVAPLFRFEAAPELIIFCAVTGLVFGIGRAVLWDGEA